MSGAPLLCLEDVTAGYGPRPAVHHVSCDVPRGALVAVVGPNGGGKSTLLKAVLGWHPLMSGSITVDGSPAGACAGRIAYLPQREQVDLDFPLTVAEVVAQGRYQRLGAFRGFTTADHAAIAAAISEFGLQALAQRPIAALSGGQQRRAFLARLVATGADVFLLDEPFDGLDAPARQDLLQRLRGWSALGRTTLVVTHDLDAVRPWFSHAVVLRTHLIAAGPVAEAFSDACVAAAFGSATAPHLHEHVPGHQHGGHGHGHGDGHDHDGDHHHG